MPNMVAVVTLLCGCIVYSTLGQDTPAKEEVIRVEVEQDGSQRSDKGGMINEIEMEIVDDNDGNGDGEGDSFVQGDTDWDEAMKEVTESFMRRVEAGEVTPGHGESDETSTGGRCQLLESITKFSIKVLKFTDQVKQLEKELKKGPFAAPRLALSGIDVFDELGVVHVQEDKAQPSDCLFYADLVVYDVINKSCSNYRVKEEAPTDHKAGDKRNSYPRTMLFDQRRITVCASYDSCLALSRASKDLLSRFETYLSHCREVLAPRLHSRGSGSDLPRVVVSMTTTPPRMQNIQTLLRVIASVLTQQVLAADMVILTIPAQSIRYGVDYPDYTLLLEGLEVTSGGRFKVVRTEKDFGPGSKLMGAISHVSDDNDIIVTIDDDSIYDPWFIANLVAHSLYRPNSVIGHVGYSLLETGPLRHPNLNYTANPDSSVQVDVLGGYGGVLYKRRFFKSVDDLAERMTAAEHRDACGYMCDDEILSSAAAAASTKRIVVPRTGAEAWFKPPTVAPPDALTSEPEHADRQGRILEHLVSTGLFKRPEVLSSSTP